MSCKAQGKAVAVTLHQNARDQRAPRAEERKRAPLPASTFDRYVGGYELRPSQTLSITRDGERFFAQLTGQPRFEIFPSGEREFFLDAVEAELSFEVDAKGHAVACTIHQGGHDTRAPRVP